MTASFVHLRVHSEYSLLDGLASVNALVEGTASLGMPALAISDDTNLFAMVKFYRAARRRGLKPLVGVDLWVRGGDRNDERHRLTLLCQSHQGFLNLSRLVTRCYLENQHPGGPGADPGWLTREGLEGLIALSGGKQGRLAYLLEAQGESIAASYLEFCRQLFGDRFYIELSRTGQRGENRYVDAAVRLAAATATPVVATNDVRFLRAGDYEAHEARVCIHQSRVLDDANRPRTYTEQQYLKSPEEMAALFADLPEALSNSVEIARRCNLELDLGATYLPEFPVPPGSSTHEFLGTEARDGLNKRLTAADPPPRNSRDDYERRLTTELGVIEDMGFPGYFLIVADFVRWARDNDIPVGPGRGSGAGSLVAYSLGITDLDPLEHELLFERFLNPERVSMPDFDIDFCMEGRDRVIEYVAERYGRDHVSQIITYGTMAARAVVRDAGRVLGYPYGFVDRVAKLIPFEIGMTLDKALKQDDELGRVYREKVEVQSIIDLAKALEGVARNAGKHAGGVVIAPRPLTEYGPLYCEDHGATTVTQFDKDDVEAVGLVKFDFLGLRTLTIIDRAEKAINELRKASGEPPVNVATLPLDDPATYALLQDCNTTAVFQLESRGIKDLIRRLQPDKFGDIVALVALYRPGPLQSGMVDDFVERKHDRDQRPIDYLHPRLASILEPTYGVILYQEQVMQIAQVLAGYSLGGADLLRRAMGKKKPEEMAKQRSVFLEGAKAGGVSVAEATPIFDLMEKFAGYGFNKSHSAAYALLAYQTAWLKAHYPAAFMAAVLSADMDNTDKIVVLRDDCSKSAIEIQPPDINRSFHEFSAAENRILYGLGAIKGVGRGAVDAMLRERNDGGPFKDLFDFCARVDLGKINRRTLEALIRSGAMDGLGLNRATMMRDCSAALSTAGQRARATAAGQNDLFGLAPAQPDATVAPAAAGLREWSEQERLAGEKDSLGLYLSGHPFTRFKFHCAHFSDGPLADVAGAAPSNGAREWGSNKRTVRVAGLIMALRRRGNRITFMLDDDSERIEVTLFEDVYREYRHLIADDAIVVVEGQLRYDDFINGWRVTAKKVEDVDATIERTLRRLVIEWDAPGDDAFVSRLRDILAPYRNGACEVCIRYQGEAARGVLRLGEAWRVRPVAELRQNLAKFAGEDRLSFQYPI